MEARSSRFLDPNAVPLKRRPEGNVWAKLVQLTKWFLLFAVCALLLVVFLPVLNNAQRYKDRKEELQHRILADKDHYAQLSKDLELLKVDPDYLQRIARDKLNLGKPGEMIFRFDPYPPASNPPPAVP